MFERFTDQTRQVVALAQIEARKLKHNSIGTEHILLGLASLEDGLAAQILAEIDADREAIRAEVLRALGH